MIDSIDYKNWLKKLVKERKDKKNESSLFLVSDFNQEDQKKPTIEDKQRLPDFNVGDLVTLLSYRFTIESGKYYIEGNTSFAAPSMVVVEVVIDNRTKDIYNELTGEQQNDRIRYRCMWYSHKTAEFKQEWFNEYLLKPTPDQYTSKELYFLNLEGQAPENSKTPSKDNKLKAGVSVNFKTASFETKKWADQDKGQSNAKPLQSFLPPTMIVKQIIVEKNPDFNLFDPRTGKQIRDISTTKVKCMWYNPTANKFVEEFFCPKSLIVLKNEYD